MHPKCKMTWYMFIYFDRPQTTSLSYENSLNQWHRYDILNIICKTKGGYMSFTCESVQYAPPPNQKKKNQ